MKRILRDLISSDSFFWRQSFDFPLLTILCRGHAGNITEYLYKVIGSIEGKHINDLMDGKRGCFQQCLCPLYFCGTDKGGDGLSDDARRVEFIRRALQGVKNCMDDGIPVKGYCYWSLMDNFEWQKGFGMTFGLIAVDRSTQTRIPKESLKSLGSFAG